MALLHVLMVLVIGWQVVVLVYPLVYWQMGSVMWANPEAHRPSEFGLALQRISAVVLIVLVFVVWVPTWDSSPSVDATDDTSTSDTDDSDDSEFSPQPSVSLVDLTATSTDGHIRGYIVEEPERLAVSSQLGTCMTVVGSVRAREEEDTVTITASYGHSDVFCDDDEPGRARDVVTLDAPLGQREVVDADGTPLRRCEQTCE